MKNYYNILNIKVSATEDDIKRNYRLLAKKYHPDMNIGDDSAAAKFADINEAYTVLSNPSSRADYDKKLQAAREKHKRDDAVTARRSAAAQESVNTNRAARHYEYGTSDRNGFATSPHMAARDPAQQQFASLKAVVFQSGYEKGIADTKRAAEREIAKRAVAARALEAELKRCKDKLDDDRDAINALRQDLLAKDREISAEKNKQYDLDRQLQVAIRSVDRVQEKADASARAADTLILSLKSDLRSARDQIKGLQEEKRRDDYNNKSLIDQLRAKLDRLQSENEIFRIKLEDCLNSLKAAGEKNKQLELKCADNDILRDELKAKCDQLASLENEKQETDARNQKTIEEQTAQNKELTTENEKLKAANEQFKTTLGDTIAENSRLKDECEELGNVREDLKKARGNIKRLQTDRRETESELRADLDKQHQKSKKLQAENLALKSKLNELNGALKDARDSNRQVVRSAYADEAELNAAKNELRRVNDLLKKAQADKRRSDASYQAQLEQQQQKRRQLQADMAELQARLNDAEAQNAALDAAGTDNAALKTELKNAIAALKKQETEKQRTDALAKKEADALNRKIEKLQAENEALKSRPVSPAPVHEKADAPAPAPAAVTVKPDDEELIKVKAELKRANESLKKLQTDLLAEKTQHGALKRKYENAMAELEKLKAGAGNSKAETEELKAGLKAAETELKNTQSELADTKDALDKAQEALAQKQAETEKLASETPAEIVELRSQLMAERDKNAELTAEADALTASLEDARFVNAMWNQYSNVEEAILDEALRQSRWNKKLEADKKLADLTLYGDLGVLVWATEEELSEAYAALEAEYGSKTDDESVRKFETVRDAYEILSDPQKRTAYNASIGITPDRMERERRAIEKNNYLQEKYARRVKEDTYKYIK